MFSLRNVKEGERSSYAETCLLFLSVLPPRRKGELGEGAFILIFTLFGPTNEETSYDK